ncbi:hypothetical protein BKP45_05145 [Anaerobacillus alkalidiazotrophicus]|uniref:Uncharacterized protein n=1 Tax=Anaerobacillus alkalidiazotrophicus TaxID=472963 RepID=A0A1S2MBX4_9BACI|nr:hypothetical protein BKP45_05145 [Anaerobacillus alkalidiazotrophicus]
MVYRPTVRYDDLYKKYVDQVFKATSLDRNQIIRLALYAAPFSPLFQHQLKKHMTSPLSSALWEATDHGLWLEQSFHQKEGGSDVNGNCKEVSTVRKPQPPIPVSRSTEGREGAVYEKRVYRQSGGITIKIG